MKHARVQRGRVPKTAPEAVNAKADAKVAELERKRDKLYTGPEGLGRRAATKLEDMAADHVAGFGAYACCRTEFPTWWARAKILEP